MSKGMKGRQRRSLPWTERFEATYSWTSGNLGCGDGRPKACIECIFEEMVELGKGIIMESDQGCHDYSAEEGIWLRLSVRVSLARFLRGRLTRTGPSYMAHNLFYIETEVVKHSLVRCCHFGELREASVWCCVPVLEGV